MTLKPYTIAPEITFPCAVADVLGNSVVTDDPYTLAEGQFGVTSTDNGSQFWYRPFRLDDVAEPDIPDPIRVPIGYARWVQMSPAVGDGIEDTFTLPETPQGDTIPFRNGRAAYGDYTVIDDTVVFDDPPVAGTRMEALFGVDSILGQYVVTFNGRPGSVVPEQDDYLDTQIKPGTPVFVASASYSTGVYDKTLDVIYTDTGDCTITISTATLARAGAILHIHNSGSTGTVTIQCEGGVLIGGASSVALTNQYDYVGLQVLPDAGLGPQVNVISGLVIASDVKTEQLTTTTPDCTNVQCMIDQFAGRGWVTGGAVTDNATSPTTQIDIAAGMVFISDETAPGGTHAFANFAAVTKTVTQGVTNYVFVKIVGGEAVADVTPDPTGLLGVEDAIIINLVFPDGAEIHKTNFERGWQSIHTLITRKAFDISQGKGNLFADWTRGAIIGVTGTRNFTLTEGVFWAGLNRKPNPPFDTSAEDTMFSFYRDGVGGHTKTESLIQINNVNWDDGSGTLASLNTGRYTNRWFYIDFNADHVGWIYDTAQYTSVSLAQEATIPTDLPAYISDFSIFLGRMIVQQGSDSVIVESAFAGELGLGVITAHNQLSSPNSEAEVQHMTSDNTAVINRFSDVSSTGNVATGVIDSVDVSSTDDGSNFYITWDVLLADENGPLQATYSLRVRGHNAGGTVTVSEQEPNLLPSAWSGGATLAATTATDTVNLTLTRTSGTWTVIGTVKSVKSDYNES